MTDLQPSLSEIETALIQKEAKCGWCGYTFTIGDIHSYNHNGGIKVRGFQQKQWVYMHCKKCGYNWALWKLINQIRFQRSGRKSRGNQQ